MEKIAWLAGLLEGEGSFFLNRNKVKDKIYLYPKIVVGMTDKDIIERVSSIFGTGVQILPIDLRRPHGKQQWRTQLQGAKAVELMRDLLPWMGERRSSKIKEILAYYDSLEPLEIRRSRSCSIAQQKRRRDEKGQYVKNG